MLKATYATPANKKKLLQSYKFQFITRLSLYWQVNYTTSGDQKKKENENGNKKKRVEYFKT